ncbi:TadE/TadG family type IV pilus assembly protein [Rhodopseudomonas sp. BR0M22]|uniref:TadE/TadG family type IV pilus assembly protein n=1 Tax=Rhodopseudomonas sp. BR0M22 TaxID=2269369 RepID=UPI0013DFD8B9|nr:TadE/TadG family type IV pilus assembly protein [Rhodopseudomonas sp. BR0M22]NEW91821.1 pilus assembly protein [Rhodopseudomonas sp. BR0M22]
MARVGSAAIKRRRGGVGVFAEDSTGVTAVEFALIATPFFAIIVALIQTFLLFFAQSVLENAVRASARQILTGQVQSQSINLSETAAAAAFKQTVCSNASVLFDCSGLMIDVEVADNWSSANIGMPTLTYGSSGSVSNTWQFNPGHAGDIVVVRVMYLWPLFFGPIAFNLANQPNGSRLIMASAAFQNEPANP